MAQKWLVVGGRDREHPNLVKLNQLLRYQVETALTLEVYVSACSWLGR
jgi:hypothetical protein